MAHGGRHEHYFAIISGRRCDVGASLVRALFWVLSLLYRCAMAVRGVYYRLAGQRVEAPVVSVGNLTVGGTGKSPLVALVARRLAEMGHRPLVVSRGYRKSGDGPGDEAADMRRRLPATAAHVESPDRVAAIREALGREPRDVVVLDDGFQHLRLRRDLDIVTIDATEPFGYDYCLPRGLLREPLSALGRAGLVVITRSDQVAAERLKEIEARVRRYVRCGAPVVHAVHAPRGLLGMDGRCEPVEGLRGARVFAFSGIANPAAFERTLESLGAKVAGRMEFADHHGYTVGDVTAILEAAARAGAERMVTTTKDVVKVSVGDLGAAWPADVRLEALEVEMELREGPGVLDGLLRRVVGGKTD